MPPLYFLHIPKTSGTTLTAYLDAHFQPHEIVGPKVWSQHLAELGPAGRSPFTRSMRGKKLIRGHFGRGVWRELDETPSVVTMLRDPVEKAISMFHHMTSERRWNNFTTPDFYREPYSFEAVMGDERARILSDHQVRHLGVDIDVKAVARSAENAYLARLDHEAPATVNLDPLPQFTDPQLSGAALFDSAWNYLQSMTFFGLQEYHQASVLLLADTLGWQPIKVADRLMTIDGRPARNQFDEAIIASVLANNELDTELYARARQLFLSRYGALASRILGERINHLDLADHESQITDRCLQKMLASRPAEVSIPVAARV